jgi:hypothetical protein
MGIFNEALRVYDELRRDLLAETSIITHNPEIKLKEVTINRTKLWGRKKGTAYHVEYKVKNGRVQNRSVNAGHRKIEF